jgi:hypothetical protein
MAKRQAVADVCRILTNSSVELAAPLAYATAALLAALLAAVHR